MYMQTRIKGRVSKKEFVNSIYPKFTIFDGEPFLKKIIETPSDLDEVLPEERIYEPVEFGLGTRAYLMYVTLDEKALIFKYSMGEGYVILWDSSIVTFGDPVDFSGSVI